MTRTQKALTVAGAILSVAAGSIVLFRVAAGVKTVAHVVALRQRAQRLMAAGRYAEAEADLRLAIRLVPSSSDSHYDLAGALHMERKDREALAECDETLRLRPRHPYVYLLQAKCHVTLNELDGAVAVCRAAVDRRPHDAERRSVLGWALIRQRSYASAEEELREAVRLDPDLASAWIYIGIAQDEQKHATDARRSFQRALELDPTSAVSHLGLGVSLGKLGDRDAAREHLRRANSLSKEPEIRDEAEKELGHLKRPTH